MGALTHNVTQPLIDNGIVIILTIKGTRLCWKICVRGVTRGCRMSIGVIPERSYILQVNYL